MNKSILNIVIDGNEANTLNRVGSNVYAFEMIGALEKITRQQSNLKFTILLAQPPIIDLPTIRPGWNYKQIGPKVLWTQLAAPIYLYWHKSEFDVYYTPGHYAPRICPIPYICSVMDLAYLYFPEQFRKNDLIQLKDWTNYSVKRAKKIVAISDFTKQDVIKHYHRSSDDVVVAYPSLAADPSADFQLNRKIFSKFNITEPYFIYVGTIQPRKNLIALVEAFESVSRFWESSQLKTKLKSKKHISREAPSIQLVIAGKIGWLADSFLQRVERSPFVNQIKILGYVTEREKRILLENAVANLMVGFYEGFGIPPLEAMALGTPAVVANNTSLPEVVGKAGILVSPHQPQSIAKGMRKVLSWSSKQKAQQRKLMKEQVQKFNWEKSAQTVLKMILQVGDKTKHG